MDDSKRLKRKVRNSYFISTVSITLVLFLLGSVGYLMLAAMKVAQTLQSSIQVSVELKNGLSDKQRQEIERQLSDEELVETIVYVPKEEKLEDQEFRRLFGSRFEEILDENPLLNSYELTLTARSADRELIEAFIRGAEHLKGVAHVGYPALMAQRLHSTVGKIRFVLLLFGGALLVRPVFRPMPAGASHQQVATLLPQHRGVWWYDFFTGEAHPGGERVSKACDLTELPLYVRGGSVLPLGEPKQSVMEGPDARLEIRIYAGADARFDLYDDSGDGFGYADGRYALVRFEWDEAASALRISRREGAYEGMACEQEFALRLFRPDCAPAEQTVRYDGRPLVCTF